MIKRREIVMLVMVALMTLSAAMVEAQPGGPGGPGGRPPMGKGGRPGQRPGNTDWNSMGDSQQASSVKQKKKVKAGDTFKVVGSLRDSVSGEFLAFVNVAVLDSVDSAFVKGGSTNFDGLFELSEIPQGAYLLRVSAIGYQNKLIPFSVSNNTALGTIRLAPGATTLSEVTISAEKPLYAMDGEKLVYNVSEDPSIQTGTTEDALQNAPGVEVDVEGNITLRGVSSVEIWINDKPSKLTEENLKTYLQTLPANALARIETITNPSAKYATSAEAVINIITTAHIKSNQFVSFGVNGSNQPFVSPWISYMWAKEKWSFNLFANGRYSFRDNTSGGWSVQRRDNAAGDGYDTVMRQVDSSASRNRSYSGNFFASLNYEIDSMSEISFDAGGMYRLGRVLSSSGVEQTYWPLSLDSVLAYGTYDSTKSPSGFGHFGADYSKKFDLEGHNMRVGVNGRFSRWDNREWYERDYAVYNDLDENHYLFSRSNSYSIDFDARYNRPYSKDGELSYGMRADYENSLNDFQRFDDWQGAAVDVLRTYQMWEENTGVNADVNWTHRWGGLTVSAGLGAGVENERFAYRTDMWFADSGSNMDYILRPSLHLTYRTEDMHNFKLNYSMRMNCPSALQESPFRRYGTDSYSTGNVNGLRDSYTHNVEAGWQKYFERFGSVGIEGYGRLSTNEISNLTDAEFDTYLDRIVNYSIPYNMGSSWRYGASLNLTYRPTGFLNVRLYANVYDYGYHFEYDRAGIHQVAENDKVSYSLRLNAWTKIFDQYQVHLSANYTSPTIGLMSQSKARYFLNMGVRSDFFKRKLSVFINIQDIFNWGARFGSGSANTNPYYLSNTTNKMLNSRYISAGITLRFGKMELEKEAKEGSSEAGDTL